MRPMLKLGLCWTCVAVLLTSLSGCQLFDLFWPQTGPVEISEALPEIPDDVLKEAAELEEAAEYFESFLPKTQPPAETRNIGGFRLNYFLNYISNYLNAKSSFLEEFTLTPDYGQDDYTKATYYFEKIFIGKQTAEMAGNDAGVICWTMFEHQVEYHVQGTFEPTTCTLKVTIDAEPLKTEVMGSSCPHYVSGIIDFAQLFITTPDKALTITKTGDFILLDVFHHILIKDFQMPIGINCPMK